MTSMIRASHTHLLLSLVLLSLASLTWHALPATAVAPECVSQFISVRGGDFGVYGLGSTCVPQEVSCPPDHPVMMERTDYTTLSQTTDPNTNQPVDLKTCYTIKKCIVSIAVGRPCLLSNATGYCTVDAQCFLPNYSPLGPCVGPVAMIAGPYQNLVGGSSSCAPVTPSCPAEFPIARVVTPYQSSFQPIDDPYLHTSCRAVVTCTKQPAPIGTPCMDGGYNGNCTSNNICEAWHAQTYANAQGIATATVRARDIFAVDWINVTVSGLVPGSEFGIAIDLVFYTPPAPGWALWQFFDTNFLFTPVMAARPDGVVSAKICARIATFYVVPGCKLSPAGCPQIEYNTPPQGYWSPGRNTCIGTGITPPADTYEFPPHTNDFYTVCTNVCRL